MASRPGSTNANYTTEPAERVPSTLEIEAGNASVDTLAGATTLGRDLLKVATPAAARALLGAGAGSDAAKAPLASPTFTGTPTAPTAASATNSPQIATTAFVQSVAAQRAPMGQGASGTFWGVWEAGSAPTPTGPGPHWGIEVSP